MMEESNSSPPTRTDLAETMPPREMTATSLVPPPMSTTMLPMASATGSPAPMAAAIGSSITDTCLAPALRAASRTARRSTAVTPEGMQMMTAGAGEHLAVKDLFDEDLQHAGGDVKVGDDAVFERAHRHNGAGGPADDVFGLLSDKADRVGLFVHGDHRGLAHDDALAPHKDEGVGGAQVDADIA